MKKEQKTRMIPMRMIFEQVEIIDFHGKCCDIAEDIAKRYGLTARVYVVECEGNVMTKHELAREYKSDGIVVKHKVSDF
jgi:hypothetical protein